LGEFAGEPLDIRVFKKTNNEKVLPFKGLALVRKLNLCSGKAANQA
jgi:hypothetical protein